MGAEAQWVQQQSGPPVQVEPIAAQPKVEVKAVHPGKPPLPEPQHHQQQQQQNRLPPLPPQQLQQKFQKQQEQSQQRTFVTASGARRSAVDVVPDEIRPGLFLGSRWAERNLDGLLKRNVKHIIQLGHGLQPTFPEHFKYITIGIHDDDSEDIMSAVKEHNLFRFISAGRKRGGTFIHCYAGVSRSATVVIAYLMWKERLPLERAMRVVSVARPDIDPNNGFMVQLNRLDRMDGDITMWTPWVHPLLRSPGYEETDPIKPRSMQSKVLSGLLIFGLGFVAGVLAQRQTAREKRLPVPVAHQLRGVPRLLGWANPGHWLPHLLGSGSEGAPLLLAGLPTAAEAGDGRIGVEGVRRKK